MNKIIYFSGEDAIAAALAERCVSVAMPDFQLQNIQPQQGGKQGVMSNLHTYFGMAKDMPLLLMLDQDEYACPPALRSEILETVGSNDLASKLVISIITRESEAWLLGDQVAISGLMGVPVSRLPDDPEALDDPKGTLVGLARKSKKVRDEICPPSSSSAKVGPGYNDVLTQFVKTVWSPDEAAKRCKSLHRTLNRLKQLGEK